MYRRQGGVVARPPRTAYCRNCGCAKQLLSLFKREDYAGSPFYGKPVCDVCYIGPVPPEPLPFYGPEGGPTEDSRNGSY